MKIRWGNYDFMGTNPASVNMLTGDLILNMNVFPYLDKFTRKFIIQHELAHFQAQTDSEEMADKIAMEKLYKSENRSLKKSVKALNDFLDGDNSRIGTIYYEALKLDKKNSMNRELFKNRTRVFPNYMLAADGGESDESGDPIDETVVTTTGRRRRDGTSRRFITFGGFVFSVGEIFMIAILLLIYFSVKKR